MNQKGTPAGAFLYAKIRIHIPCLAQNMNSATDIDRFDR